MAVAASHAPAALLGGSTAVVPEVWSSRPSRGTAAVMTAPVPDEQLPCPKTGRTGDVPSPQSLPQSMVFGQVVLHARRCVDRDR